MFLSFGACFSFDIYKIPRDGKTYIQIRGTSRHHHKSAQIPSLLRYPNCSGGGAVFTRLVGVSYHRLVPRLVRRLVMPSRSCASRCVVSSVVPSSRRLVSFRRFACRLVFAPFCPAVCSFSSRFSFSFVVAGLPLCSRAVSPRCPSCSCVPSSRLVFVVLFPLVVLFCLVRGAARACFRVRAVPLCSSLVYIRCPSRFLSPLRGGGSGVMTIGWRWIALCVSSSHQSGSLFPFASLTRLWDGYGGGMGAVSCCSSLAACVLSLMPRRSSHPISPHRLLVACPSPSPAKQGNERTQDEWNRTRRPTRWIE